MSLRGKMNKTIPKKLTFEHNYCRRNYPVSGYDYIIEQFNNGHITRELAIRRLYDAGIQNPESLLEQGVVWEIV